MGCDIHFFIERRNNAGDWEHVEHDDDLWRDYDMFSLLAGVRGGLEQILHGYFPEDTSIKKLLSEHDYYHSHTCITLAEFLAFNWNKSFYDENHEKHYKTSTCKHCGSPYYQNTDESRLTYADRFHGLMAIIEFMKTLDENPDNVRAIMAFDS